MTQVEDYLLKGDEGEDISIEGNTPEERKESLRKILLEQKLMHP